MNCINNLCLYIFLYLEQAQPGCKILFKMDTEVERVHKVTDLDRVLRFLCVGNVNGSYARQKEFKRETVDSIVRYFFFKSHRGGVVSIERYIHLPLSALKYMIRS